MKHLLSINGLDGPLARILGCDCGRCTSPTRQAHTSASLISQNDQGETVHHILFDAGLGVSESLLANPHLQGSGHPDGLGNPGWGWENGRWQAEAQQVWQAKNLPGQVHVPAIGDTFCI